MDVKDEWPNEEFGAWLGRRDVFDELFLMLRAGRRAHPARTGYVTNY